MGKNKMHLKKESASQETKNLLTEDPVADREKDTILMKKGHRASIMKHMSPIGKYDHSYKKTKARIAEDFAGNAAYDFRHGYTSEGDYEEKKAIDTINKKGGLFDRKYGRHGLVKGTKRRAPRRSRG